MILGPTGLEDALARAGRVGADLLAVDWSVHPLGPPATWPPALANAVRIVVTSRFSMWMAWGEDLTFFCNDAYRRDTLGSKYPWALGRPASRVWEEIWPDIGPRIAHVTATGEATWDESLLLFLERSGYAEETYHTFSYSPLTGDDGAVAGMLCVVTEDTERVVGERRMRTLRDLGTDPAVARDEEEVLRAAGRYLAADDADLPFTLAYLWDDGGAARLVASTGFGDGHPAAPATLCPRTAEQVWPTVVAAQGHETVVALVGDDGAPRRPEYSGLPCGAWSEPPREAAVVPLGRPGEDAAGFLVAGLNRYRPFDDAYLGFVRLVAGHLGTSVAAARAYESERRRAEALAELDRAKTTFFTNVSHEFRTPLTLLLGPVEDALADAAHPLDAVQHDRLEVMRRNALRMLKLVNMLLDFSRLESGRTRARFEEADLGRYTRELASMFAPAFDRAGLALDVDAAPVSAFVDHEMWAKIVLNLLSNALKHTFAGGVRVSVREDGDGLVLAVADTGIGIPAAEQGHLFERFHRVLGARSRSHEGSGIGLALVAELVALHGGTTGVDSVPGRGSTFTVRIPAGSAHLPPEQVAAGPPERPGVRTQVAVRQAAGFLAEAERWGAGGPSDDVPPALARPAPSAPSLPDAPVPAGGTAPSGGLRPDAAHLLVVDDNADMRAYLVSLLTPAYVVETAADGLEALERVRARRPDLVVSDVMMPGLDGFALLKELRQDPATAGVPVVLLSARAGDEATVEGLDAGADDYLVKPFSTRELLARVRSNLELDRSRRTLAELERHRALLDQTQRLAAVGSWEYDFDAGRTVLSAELVRLLGRTAEELDVSRARPDLGGLVHPDDVVRFRAAADRAAHGEPLDVEVRLVAAAGVRPFRVIGELVRDGTGRPVRLRGSAQDVTEQHRTAALQAAAAAEREAAAREQTIAEELQTSLLPSGWDAPDHLDIATFYRAGVRGTRIGGDWFDVIGLGAGRTALVIGDVMGRGVGAAAVMAQLRAAVRAFARLDLPPADLLELLDGVVRDLGDDHIVTCVYAVYDPGDRTLTYANAGHLPPLLVAPGGNVRRLDGRGDPPLGTGPFTLVESSVHLPARSTLVLYTDGLVEHRDSDLDAGIGALAEALGAGRRPGDPEQLARTLLPDGADDDVAILVAHVGRAHPATSALVFPLDGTRESVSRTRRLVDEVLARWDVPAHVRDDALLAASELVTNAVLHGSAPAELRLRRGRDHVVLEVHDAASFLPRKLRPGNDDEHGRGLQIVATLATRWGTRPTARGKAVWCILPVG